MSQSIRVGIFGANGRMGRNLVQAAREYQGIELSKALVRKGSSLAGIDAGELAGMGSIGLCLEEASSAAVAEADIMVDFTLPEPLMEHLTLCVENNTPLVTGVTGLNEQQLAAIDEAAKHIPIVFAPNMSVGVNLMLNLLKTAANVMGNYTDIEVIEAHHRHKKDAPSGTAMAIGEVIAETLGRDLKTCAVYGREGDTGERDQNTIGFATVRAGDIIGEHTTLFADIGERLEITHKASSRMTFAKGAMRAVAWLVNQQPGIFSMQNVLGFE